jgi:RNA polymerase sigma factor (sigma-70 family)
MMSPMPADVRTDAELVVAARGQEAGAYGELFQRWYDRSYDVALNILRDRESAADVAQDAFLTGWERLTDLRAPAAFGGWILRTTRNRALNRLSRDRSRAHEPIDEEHESSSGGSDPGVDPAVLAEREDQRRLVWTAVAVLGERDTSILDLHLRHGLEPSEIAEELHITANNASQLLFRLRRKLRDAVGSVLLWREGNPTCPALAELLEGSGTFDLSVASVIRQHRRSCPTCNRELSQQTDPERLFAAVPFAIAPLAMKDGAIAVLAQAGAPMAASSAASAATAASAVASTAGVSTKLLAIGGGAIGFGLLITIGLWPSDPGGGNSAQGTVPVTQEPTPTAVPTTSTPAETETNDPEGSAGQGSTDQESSPPDGHAGDDGSTTDPPTDPATTPEPSDPDEPSVEPTAPASTDPVVWEPPEWSWCERPSCSVDLSWSCCGGHGHPWWSLLVVKCHHHHHH